MSLNRRSISTYRASAAPTTSKSRNNVNQRETAALASEARIWTASHNAWVGASCKRLLGSKRSGRFGARNSELLEKRGQAGLVEPTLGDRDHGVVEEAARIGHEPAVDVEEDQGGIEGRPLVTIDEGLILRDVKGIRGRHVKEIWMEEISGKGRRRSRDSRIERRRVTETVRPAEKAKLIGVKGKHFFSLEEKWSSKVGHLASLRNVRS